MPCREKGRKVRPSSGEPRGARARPSELARETFVAESTLEAADDRGTGAGRQSGECGLIPPHFFAHQRVTQRRRCPRDGVLVERRRRRLPLRAPEVIADQIDQRPPQVTLQRSSWAGSRCFSLRSVFNTVRWTGRRFPRDDESSAAPSAAPTWSTAAGDNRRAVAAPCDLPAEPGAATVQVSPRSLLRQEGRHLSPQTGDS